MVDENAVEVPLRVTWATMFTAKLAQALRPSRLVLFVAGVGGLSVGLVAFAQFGLCSAFMTLFVGLAALRLTVMLLSSWLDRGARRFDRGQLIVRSSGLRVVLADGTVLERGWDWILDAKEHRGVLRIRLDERGGRLWLTLAEHGSSVRPWLERAGKLRASG